MSIILIILLVVVIGSIAFLDQIIEKSANTFLNPINESFRGQISSVNIDYSQAKATFSIEAKNRKTGDEILKVKEVVADYDFGAGLKILINDVKLAVDRNTINELQEMADDNRASKPKEKESTDTPPLGLLSEFELNNFHLVLPDSRLETRIKKILVNFDKGSGKITSITATNQNDNLRFIEVPEVDLGFSEKFFSQEIKTLSVHVENPAIKVNQELLSAFEDALPETRQAQSEPPPKESSKNTSSLSVLETFSVNNISLEVIGSSTLNGKIESLSVDMKQGNGRIENISASASNSKLMTVDTIEVGFNQKSLLAGKSAQLTFKVDGTEVNVTQSGIHALKGLPKPPEFSSEDEEKNETGVSALEQVKSISVNDTKFTLHPQGLVTKIDKVTAMMKDGKAQMGEINSTLIKNGKKVLRVEKITARFDPEKLSGPEKPELKIAVIDTDLRVSNELMNNFKKQAQVEVEKDKPSKNPGPLPVVISRVLIGDAKVSFVDYPGIGKQKYLSINEIFGNIYNITLEPGTPLGSFTFNATFEGGSKFITNGSLDLADSPMQWSADWKLFNFDMTKLNEELRARIPLTFNEGVLDFYGEAIQTNERIVGYVKPVLEEGDYFGNQNEFKGVRHFLAETFATFTNWLFERDKSNTVATKIPFVIKDGQMDTKVGEAAWNAVKHGLTETEKVERGVEEDYRLKQAQEEE